MTAFWLGLLARMSASAFVVVAATVAAEAAGPFWGGLIVSLPIGAGPAYVMLALQHDAAFIGESALGSFAVNAATFLFLAVLALLAGRVHWALVLVAGLATWAGGAALIRLVEWDVAGACVLNVGAVVTSLWVTRGVGRGGAAPRQAVRRRWFELPARAAMVGLVVGLVVTGSNTLGPSLTGLAAVFPVAFTSFSLLVLPRMEGPVAAAIMVSALRAMPGFGLALLVLHLGALSLGAAGALCAALLASLAWSALLLAGRWRAGRSARRSIVTR